MPSQASSLLSAKLRCYFSGLPSHFEADFSEFSALPGHSNHAFHSTGSTFLTFSQFSLHIASSPSLRASFCRFSGPLGTSRRPPGPTFSGQKGRRRKPPPPFLAYMCPSSLPTSQMVPPKPQNDPKTSPNPAENAPPKPQIRRPPSYFSESFLLPAS